MSDLFNFDNEEECMCEACQMTESYLNIALETNSVEELRNVLRGLFDDGFNTGYEDALRDDVGFKLDMLNKKHEDLI